MGEAANAILNNLLGADFPKLAGLFGFAFILLGVTGGEVRLAFVKIPQRDRIGRTFSLILGSLFVAVPLASAILGTTIGLVNVGGAANRSGPIVRAPAGSLSGLFIGGAHARTASHSITVTQRSVTDLANIFGGAPWAVYVGDIHLEAPNYVLIYRSGGGAAAHLENGLGEAEIERAVSRKDRIAAGRLKQGDSLRFEYDGRAYALKVDSVLWYLIGDDLVTLSIGPR